MKVMKNEGLADGRPGPAPGQYLKSYNPEGFSGMGAFTWTQNREEALKFNDAMEAFKLWTAVPSNRPRRPDGKPNKPLTSFTITIEDA